MARATYARDFKGRTTGMWQEYSVLKAPDESDSPLYKIADPATDGPAPVSLLEAVMRAYPGLEDRAAPEVHLLRHREGDDREAEDIVYDLNTLTQANPPPLPECKPGDVLLLLPRVAKPPTSLTSLSGRLECP